MGHKRILKTAVIAIGVLASVAFYASEGKVTGDAVMLFGAHDSEDVSGGEGGSGAAGVDGETGSEEPDGAYTGAGGGAPGQAGGTADGAVSAAAGDDKEEDTFSEEQKSAIEEIVRSAVRDELMSICEEGYLETALDQAAELAAAEAEALKGMVNINTADVVELTTLPGIGESRAADIIAYREEAGGFASVEELMNVSGIGEATFAKLKEKIYVQ